MAGNSSFSVDSRPGDTGWTIAATGELDSGTSPVLLEAFDRAGSGEIHLDLAALSFIDSAGLRAIIQLERVARERGLPLVVTPPPAPLTELLELTGLAARLRLAADQAQAPLYRPFVERVEVELEAELTAPAQARREIRQVAHGHLDPTTLDAAVLLTSELVANAVIHPQSRGGRRVVLRITTYEHGIRCDVGDEGPGFDPENLGPRDPDTGGRGLILVNALAKAWGTERSGEEDGGRFWVWFELEAEGPPVAEPPV